MACKKWSINPVEGKEGLIDRARIGHPSKSIHQKFAGVRCNFNVTSFLGLIQSIKAAAGGYTCNPPPINARSKARDTWIFMNRPQRGFQSENMIYRCLAQPRPPLFSYNLPPLCRKNSASPFLFFFFFSLSASLAENFFSLFPSNWISQRTRSLTILDTITRWSHVLF